MQIDIRKIIEWNDNTSEAFRHLVAADPAILTLPSDIRESSTVADTMQHIVAVELRYAQRLASLPEDDYEVIPKSSIEELHRVHVRARDLIAGLLDDGAYDWQQELEFTTRSAGVLRCSREVVLVHALTHSIRHHAQLATLLRQHGHKVPKPLDYIFLFAERK